jgi:hypothetical protein
MEQWVLSWSKLFELSKEYIDTIPDKKAGVFRLSKAVDDNAVVFYVGESTNLRETLSKILNGTAEIPSEVKSTIDSHTCYFRYSLIRNDDVRGAALNRMYHFYRPSGNSEEPTTSRKDISINLN